MACFVSYSYTSFHWKTNSLIRKTEICRKKGTGKVYSSRDLVAALPKTPTPQKDPVQEKNQTKRSNETSVNEDSFFSLILNRVVDTVDDAMVHFNRTFFPPKIDPQAKKPTLVILGTGWAAHSLIKVIDTVKYDVRVVSPRNYFLFTPMLPSTAVGTVEFRSIVETFRTANPFVDYFEAHCVDVDLQKQVAVCESNIPGEKRKFQIFYDYLVIAVGAATNTFGTPGVQEHCYFLKEISDARGLRRAIVERFELASFPDISKEEKCRLLSFVVVGGGPTGCEFAAELHDFLVQDLKKYYPKLFGDVQVLLLQSGDSILTQFDRTLQEKALENFRQSNIQVITKARVTEVTSTHIRLVDGKEIPYGLAVWAAGNGTQPLTRLLLSKIPEQKEARGRLLVDSWLRVKGALNVFAVGDCAAMEPVPLPATAQVAGQQGAYLARLFNRDYCLSCPVPESEEKSTAPLAKWRPGGSPEVAKPFQFLSLGILAYIGRERAMAQIETGLEKIKMAGVLTYLLWQSVYITKQVSFRNRVLVLFDWFKTRVFGRDMSQF
ncbi:NADH dehydrogenase isoform 1 [Galdieria sulphuraria]|uniref:NADH dehydrogenase isoform 1 n=1 Tax=Galdieria sulphuraria TaxID=130081 RepID=M2XEG9_GALSU|nr:NADH dehydrogenase isoform 1 [Galdieria sulphuraria]EME28347.1 NADH dehydrogenase isoform 1 [Galdieria sulphuraria]|eukprot:XP_005704867.1 NADH dehydrogenase isoform 1 [Galdieria sulphuraria]